MTAEAKLSNPSSIRLIISNIFGAGVLTIPNVFASAGCIGGIIASCISSLATFMACYFLCLAAMKKENSSKEKENETNIPLNSDINTNDKEINDTSVKINITDEEVNDTSVKINTTDKEIKNKKKESVSYASLGEDLEEIFIPKFINILKLLICYLSTVAYFMFMNEFIMNSLYSVDLGMEDAFLFRCIIGGIITMILLPITVLITSTVTLSQICYATTFGVGYLFFLTLILPFMAQIKTESTVYINSSKILSAIAVMTFSINFQTAVVTLYSDFADKSKENVKKLLFIGVLIATTVYLTVGICGYLVLGEIGSVNIFSLLIAKENHHLTFRYSFAPLMTKILSYIGIFIFTIGLAGSFACQNYVGRASVLEILNKNTDANLITRVFMGIIHFVILNIVSAYVSDPNLVIGLIGAFCMPFICYILPSSIDIKINYIKKKYSKFVVPVIIILLGVVVLCYAPYDLLSGSEVSAKNATNITMDDFN